MTNEQLERLIVDQAPPAMNPDGESIFELDRAEGFKTNIFHSGIILVHRAKGLDIP